MRKKAEATTLTDHPDRIVVFQEKAIRRTWQSSEWWFAVVDVVAVLTDSVQPEGYVKDLRRRDKELAKGWGQIAISVNDQWRICFRFKGADAYDVEFCDYH